MKRKISVGLSIILVLLTLSSGFSSHAQSNITYDYVILMDASGSMMEKGTPPLFEQLRGSDLSSQTQMGNCRL